MSSNQPVPTRRMKVVNKLRKLIEINLFEHVPNSDQKSQQYGTRIYILFLIVCLIVFLFYTIISTETITQTIFNPSQSTYTQIFESLSSDTRVSLRCPCSSISIRYQELISPVNILMHEVCSSQLLDNEWLSFLETVGYLQYLHEIPLEDMRDYGASFFSNLRSLCFIANTTLQDHLSRFYNEELISSYVLRQNEFESQIQQLVLEFRRILSTDAVRIIDLILAVWHGNQYVSGYFTNWKYELRPDYRSRLNPIPSKPVIHADNCSCAASFGCFRNAFIRDIYSHEIFNIPGMMIGCKFE